MKQNEHSWDSTDGVSQKENVIPRKKTTLVKNTCGRKYVKLSCICWLFTEIAHNFLSIHM